MEIEIRIDPGCSEPRIIIHTAQVTPKVLELMERIQNTSETFLTGFRDGGAEILEPEAIIRIATVGGKVYAYTDSGSYQLRLRLYQAEERLKTADFVRISQSEIVNIHKVRQFDLSTTGVICIRFTNGDSSYVARRYLRRIRTLLGLMEEKTHEQENK